MNVPEDDGGDVVDGGDGEEVRQHRLPALRYLQLSQMGRRQHLGVVMFCPCLFCPSDNFETCLALPTN